MSLKIYLLLMVMALSVGSCDKTEYKTTLVDRGMRVDCFLKNVEARESRSTGRATLRTDSHRRSIVYGKIELTSMVHEEITYNLNDYRLVLGDKFSSHPYIDSFVDYLLTDQVLGPGQRISRDVYWVFDGEIAGSDLKSMELVRTKEP